MPSSAANAKGLFCKPKRMSVHAESFELVAQACEGHATGRNFIALLRKLSWPGTMPGGAQLYPAGWFMCHQLCPGGYGHRTHAWEQSASELRKAWSDLLELRSRWDSVHLGLLSGAWPRTGAALLAPPGPATLREACAEIESFIPRQAAMKRHLGAVFADLEPGWEARGGEAYAIWMGGAKLGFMSDTKRPVGAAAARLFESVEAAAHKLRAVHLGASQRRAAIVRMRVELVAIESSEPGSSAHGPRMAIASREARELEDSLIEASLDEITRALGEVSEPGSFPHAPRDPVAGRQEGFACWVDGAGGQKGFVNPLGEVGSLQSATLKATAEAAARRGSTGQITIVRVACWPVAIEGLTGTPDLSRLAAAIAWEEEAERREALARQSAQALRERARVLSSGEAAPRRSSGRL